MENTYCVYKHTGPTGKSYVGMTKHGDNPNKRWQNGKKYNECPTFYEAIQMYGWDAFSHDILANGLSFNEAEEMERYWIMKLESNVPGKGYNLASGGINGYCHSEQSRMKTSMSHLGIRPSEETKEKLRKIALARPPMSQETKDKISKANKGHTVSEKAREARRARLKGRVLSEETKRKIGKKSKGNTYRRKKVMCLETGRIFDSAKEAAISVGRSKSGVVAAIARNGICNGFHWKYV